MLQAAREREEWEKEGNLGDEQYSIQLNTIRVNESTQHWYNLAHMEKILDINAYYTNKAEQFADNYDPSSELFLK